MRVPLLDLTRQNERVGQAVSTKVQAVFDSQQFILGRTVEDFEKAFCDYVGCGHAVGMSSGTDAELAILMALGLGAGDAIITTPYTFFATAGCIHRVGAEVVFVDVLPGSLQLDPEKLRERLAGGLRTKKGNLIKAIMPVHLFGTCYDVDAIHGIAAEHGLLVIEDAAQAIGAEHRSQKGSAVTRAGALGDAAFFSFFPTKNLGGAGDAGMAVCRSVQLAEKLRLVRNHGMEQRYFHRMVGGNFRIDAIQAAVLHAKLPFVEQWNEERRRNAEWYRQFLGDLEQIQLPAEPWRESGLKNAHTWHQYVMRAERRDDLLRHLAEKQIGHAVYYPVPLHLQECFAYLGYKEGDFPEAERAALETVALPIFPELKEEEIDAVATAIRAFYG